MASPSVTSIGRNGFRNCSNLTSLVLPSSLISIGEMAFAECTGLTSLTIPSSVDTFGYGAFAGCRNLQSIRVNGLTPIEIAFNSSVFSGVNTETCILYVPVGTKDSYAAAYRWKDFKNIVEFELLLSVSHNSVAISDTTGSAATFDISSNTEWKISSAPNWLSISDTMGINNDSVILTAEANPNTVERTGLVTVSGLGTPSQTITVTQAPKPDLSVSSNVLSIGAQAGSTALLNITSNTDWTMNSGQEWLTTSQSSGNGVGTLTLTAEANPTNASREATVTFSADRVSSQTVIVTQDASTPSGISNISSVTFYVYPNPVKDILHINAACGTILVIYNSQGQFILSRCLESDHEILDLSSLPSGVYMIKAGNKTWKILK